MAKKKRRKQFNQSNDHLKEIEGETTTSKKTKKESQTDCKVNEQHDQGKEDTNENDPESSHSDDESEDEEEDVQLDGTAKEDPHQVNDSSIINVTFDFCDPNEKHFHSVKGFLKGFIPGIEINLSDLADLIIAQASVGTLVCSEYDDVFAFSTVLNMRFRKESQSIQQITKALSEKCPENLQASFQSILEAPDTGLVVSRRMVNLPLQLIPPLHSALVDDIAWAKENEISEEHRKQFELDKLVFISPCEVVGPEDTVYYSHFEEEVLAKESELSFLFNPMQKGAKYAQKNPSFSEASRNCSVFLISIKKYQECFAEIERLVGTISS
mmetsp:Transcript_35789/g.47243  ORF Transcript_35789/g.47243 Transcript_35789/m.47243 type:complete len:326 (+) Transcript_35789:53-1030(+)|eukprot:CAMPEP_0117838590 /NCGR_PEP_ID=MMETSP0949-20121206/13449_1 /TAXON_ID=44440 /ORGANISM="Chattonella subsalsa, Strain CCMP2191" /LENGTH=325 /DNA_ID=CAMNT_0005681355 /DNA_START=19 /DNA_END=996 /DNA_ORIENTATION=-